MHSLQTENDFLSLVAHKIAPFQFDLGVGAVNASIRDQIVRAQMVVRALWKLEQSSQAQSLARPLLICGAGVAGLAAADEAERLKMGFVLVEKGKFPGGALAGKGKRYLSPTMYEWPAPLFTEHIHPRSKGTFLGADKHTRFKLNFGKPVEISELRRHLARTMKWKLRFWRTMARAGKGKYWFIPNARISRTTKNKLQELLDMPEEQGVPASSLPRIKLTLSNGHVRSFDAKYILFAGGFSAEKTEYGKFEFDTPPFWQEDGLTERHFGLGNNVGRVSAFIAGAGDGAIQDALRCLVTSRIAHPVEIWEEIIQSPGNPAVPVSTASNASRTIESILIEVLSLENYVTTAFMWSGDKDAYQCVDKRHRELCFELLKLAPFIKTNIRGMVRDDVARVHVQRNRLFFTRCYPLNRFLIHLMRIVLRDLKKNTGQQKNGHVPMLTFGHGYPDGATRFGKGLQWKGHTYHKVVVRTGAVEEHFQTIGLTRIDPARFSFGRMPPPFMPAKIEVAAK